MHGRPEGSRPKRRRSSVPLHESTSGLGTSYTGSAFTDAELLAFEGSAGSSYRQNRDAGVPLADATRSSSQCKLSRSRLRLLWTRLLSVSISFPSTSSVSHPHSVFGPAAFKPRPEIFSNFSLTNPVTCFCGCSAAFPDTYLFHPPKTNFGLRSLSRRPSLWRLPSSNPVDHFEELPMRQPLRRRASSRNLNERLNFGIPELGSGASAFEERSDPYDQDAYPQLPPLRRRGSDASLRTIVRHPTMTSLPQLDQGASCDEATANAGSTSSIIATADSARNTCEECGRSFTRKGDLDRHMRSHVAEPAHWCSRCQKGFVRRDAKLRHERTCTA